MTSEANLVKKINTNMQQAWRDSSRQSSLGFAFDMLLCCSHKFFFYLSDQLIMILTHLPSHQDLNMTHMKNNDKFWQARLLMMVKKISWKQFLFD